MGIGKRLKEAREATGLTQEELGRRVGVTGSAITNYEKEVSHPKESVMYALFDVLQVEPNFLFQDCVKIKKTPGQDGPRDEKEREFMEYVGRMTDEQKRFLAAVMKVMIEQDQELPASDAERVGGTEKE